MYMPWCTNAIICDTLDRNLFITISVLQIYKYCWCKCLQLTTGESMLQSETAVSSGYGSSQNSVRSVNTAASNALTELSNSSSKASTAVDVSLAYNSVSEPYQTPAYQKTQATPSYQTPVSTYNSSNYSTSQVWSALLCICDM